MLGPSFSKASAPVYELGWHDEAVPEPLRNAVVAIGNFDGLHRGHQAVIARAKALGERLGKPCILCTFEPHPADYFAGHPVVFRLTPPDAMARMLGRLGVAGMAVLPFDARMAALSAEDFVRDILVGRFDIAAAVVGYDFHFGQGRTGSPGFLAEAGHRFGFEVEVIERIAADQQGALAAVSSTAIRRALEAGEVGTAACLLGYDYFVTGTVLHGQKLGRTLGYPTANMRLESSCRLAHGIYAVTVEGQGFAKGGVASFGRRPTFDNGAPLLESYLFDFAGDLYGQSLDVAFIQWIRPEQKFDGIDDLVRAMKNDESQARIALEQHRRANPM